jgi:hypothetical protein
MFGGHLCVPKFVFLAETRTAVVILTINGKCHGLNPKLFIRSYSPSFISLVMPEMVTLQRLCLSQHHKPNHDVTIDGDTETSHLEWL